MSLDAARFHWSPVPLWLQIVGAALLMSSFEFLFLTFRENSYLSPVVRIQAERGHSVVTTGLYGYVRHPMYSALLVFVMGTSLLLGSGYGVIFGLVTMALLARRAVLEERMLLRELPGYSVYTADVKYRLIPHVW
jgi:protein-S-isoprenylcysteine O-methyltransferase Ste14